jgi:hypothetical protein
MGQIARRYTGAGDSIADTERNVPLNDCARIRSLDVEDRRWQAKVCD